MIDFVKVGLRIAEHRRRLSLSQDTLAEKLFVTRQAVSKWERGASVPSIETLADMSRLFGVSFEEILGLYEEPPSELYPDDIFAGHDRGYVIKKIVSGEISVDLPTVLYQMSPAERMYILRRIKDGALAVSKDELIPRLADHELKYLGWQRPNIT